MKNKFVFFIIFLFLLNILVSFVFAKESDIEKFSYAKIGTFNCNNATNKFFDENQKIEFLKRIYERKQDFK